MRDSAIKITVGFLWNESVKDFFRTFVIEKDSALPVWSVKRIYRSITVSYSKIVLSVVARLC